MKMRRIWAYFIVLSMLLCQNLILPVTVNAAAGDAPLIYYDFDDAAEWTDADDIAQCASESDAIRPLTADVGKRVRGYDSTKTRLSFKSYGSVGRALYYDNNNGSLGWRNLMLYIDDGSGNMFNTNRTLYIKLAYWISAADASSTSTSVQIGWSSPWTNETDHAFPKAYTATVNGGWNVFTGTLPGSSHGNMTSNGPTIQFAAKVNGDYYIKYIALFDSQEAANSWDPSINSATFDGNTMTVDNGNRTMSLTLGGVTSGSLTSIDDKISITTQCGAVTAVKNGDPTVTETIDNIIVTQNYDVTDIVGNVKTWTATVTLPILAPDEPYLFFDFTTMPSNTDLTLGAGTNAANIANYGCDFGKTDSDAAKEIYCANNSYGGPGLFIRAYYEGYGTNAYTQVLLYSDKFDMTKTQYARIEYTPCSINTSLGNGGVGRVIARWEATSGNGNVLSYSSGNPTLKNVTTAIIQVDPVNSGSKIMRIGFYNFAPTVNVKSVGLFSTRAEAEAFDPSLRSVVINGKKAAINGVTHTATVELADNIAPADMPTLSSSDITRLVCDNVGATTTNGYVHQAATAAIVADSQEITEDLTSVMSSVDYTVTDKTGTAHTWKMILKSKKNGMAAAAVVDQYYIMDFTDAEITENMIYNGEVGAWEDHITDVYPLNASRTSSALHAVKDSGGRVGMRFTVPTDSKRFRWYAKALLNYDNDIASGKNFQIRWANWDTRIAAYSYESAISAGEWLTASVYLNYLSPNVEDLAVYTNTGSDINVKYIALFGSEADRDAFDPSVISGSLTKSGTRYVAQVDNIAHTITFPTGCGTATDLDSAVLTLYNGGTGITAVSQGAAAVTQNLTGGPYEVTKTYTVTGLDGTTNTWTAIIPFTTAVNFITAGNTVTATFADQLSGMMNCIAVFRGESNVLYFAANNSGEGTLSVDTSGFASGTYTLKAFSFFDGDYLPVIKEQTYNISK